MNTMQLRYAACYPALDATWDERADGASSGQRIHVFGPLARRIILLARPEKPRAVTVEGFVAGLTSAWLDPETGPAVTHAQGRQEVALALLTFKRLGLPPFKLSATGGSADLCCPAALGRVQTKLSGSLRILARPPRHWLLAGEPRILESSIAELVGFIPEPELSQ
jgi:hypothetical protein